MRNDLAGGDCPDPDNATNHDAAPAARAQPDPAGRDSDKVAGTGDILADARKWLAAFADSRDEQRTHYEGRHRSWTHSTFLIRRMADEIDSLRLTDAERLRGTPAAYATQCEGSEQNGCTLTDAERMEIEKVRKWAGEIPRATPAFIDEVCASWARRHWPPNRAACWRNTKEVSDD